jgi:probable blue pigment (indigoidine) exporter
MCAPSVPALAVPTPAARSDSPTFAGIGGPAARTALVTAIAPLTWGTTYLVTTELLPAGRPLLAAALRALPAGLVLAAATRRSPVGAWWVKALVLGTLNIGAFFALLFVAAYRLPGGIAATLGAIQPLVAAGLAAVVVHERVRLVTVAAGLLGVTGVALLVLRADAALDPLGIAAGLAGAASMATGVALTKRWGRPVPLLAFTSWQLLAGGLLLLPLALVVEGRPPPLTGTNLAGFAWLATGGTALAYSLWLRGIERLPVARVSILGLLAPLVATVVGWLALGQSLTPAQLGGGALVLAAVGLGQWPAPSPSEPLRSAQVGQGGPHGAGPVADGVLLVGGHLGEAAAVALDRHHDGVVAEPTRATGRIGHHGLDRAPFDDLAAIGPDHGDRGDVAAGPRRGRHAVELAQHAGDPVGLVGPAGGPHAGRAAELVDLDARVVGHGGFAGGRGERAGLEQGVGLEGVPGLLDVGVAGDDVPARAEDVGDLGDLVGVAGRQPDPPDLHPATSPWDGRGVARRGPRPGAR